MYNERLIIEWILGARVNVSYYHLYCRRLAICNML